MTTMFHPFRNTPKRKVHNTASKQTPKQKPTEMKPRQPAISTLNVLRQKPQQGFRPKKVMDDDSVDLSVYTSESRTTVQYNGVVGQYNAATGQLLEAPLPYSTPQKKGILEKQPVLQKEAILEKQPILQPRKLLPDDDSVNMSIYTSESKTTVHYDRKKPNNSAFKWQSSQTTPTDLSKKPLTGTRLHEWMLANSQRTQTLSTAPSTPEGIEKESDLKHEPVSSKRRHGPIDLDEANLVRSSGPIDLDESIADDDSSTQSWIMSSNRMTSPAVWNNKKVTVTNDDTTATTPLQYQKCEDEEKSLSIWTDNEDDTESADKDAPLINELKLSYEETEVLNKSYHDTMKSIATRRQPEDEPSEDLNHSTRAPLTQEQLRKHLETVQTEVPAPKSPIDGYDAWKQEQEYQRRYFETKRRKEAEKAKLTNLTRSTAPSASSASHGKSKITAPKVLQNRPERTRLESDSGPLRVASKPTKEQSKQRRRWNLIPKIHTTTNKKENNTEKKATSENPTVSTLIKIERESRDEPSEITMFSLAPLNTRLGMDTGDMALKEGISGGSRIQLELDSEEQETLERERIRKLKERELQRQREMNRRPATNPMTTPRSMPADHSIGSRSSSVKAPYEATSSFASDHSRLSSIQSGPTIVLSPCIICNAAERSHIAMPCMHFSFCQNCVDVMSVEGNTTCPICSVSNVSYSRVYTR